jgi:hypothetical protein
MLNLRGGYDKIRIDWFSNIKCDIKNEALITRWDGNYRIEVNYIKIHPVLVHLDLRYEISSILFLHWCNMS